MIRVLTERFAIEPDVAAQTYDLIIGSFSRDGSIPRDGMDTVVKAAAEEIRKDAPGKQIMVNAAEPLGETAALKHYPLVSALSFGAVSAFTPASSRIAAPISEAAR